MSIKDFNAQVTIQAIESDAKKKRGAGKDIATVPAKLFHQLTNRVNTAKGVQGTLVLEHLWIEPRDDMNKDARIVYDGKCYPITNVAKLIYKGEKILDIECGKGVSV